MSSAVVDGGGEVGGDGVSEADTSNLSIHDRLALLRQKASQPPPKQVHPRRVKSEILATDITAASGHADDGTGDIKRLASLDCSHPEEPEETLASPGDTCTAEEVGGASARGLAARLAALEESQSTWQQRRPLGDTQEAQNLTVRGRAGGAKSMIVGEGDTRQLRRGASFSRRDREHKFRSRLSDIPIILKDMELAAKVPEVPWAATASQPHTNTPVEVIKNEVTIFNPGESATLNAFYSGGDANNEDRVERLFEGSAEIDLDAIAPLPPSNPTVSESAASASRVKRPAGPKRNRKPPSAVSSSVAKSSYTEQRPVNPLQNFTPEGLTPNQKQALLTKSAVAGLASTENFGSVKLTNMEETRQKHQENKFNPYNPIMLIMIKGRHQLQVRLVEPTAKSINESDSFLLVTRDELIVWKGALSNIVEQNKAMELGKLIVERHDLGCQAPEFDVIEGEGTGPGQAELKNHFFEILDPTGNTGEGDVSEATADPDAEDLWFEECVTATNKVYLVDTEADRAQLLPLRERSCLPLPHSLLGAAQTLVIDCGAEVYCWCGRDASTRDRALGPLLAMQLFEDGYDYTGKSDAGEDFVLCPLFPLDDSAPLVAPSRPQWALCGKVNGNMETLLFAHKFADWPEANFMKEVRGAKNFHDPNAVQISLIPIQGHDFQEMLKPNPALSAGYIVEVTNVGRGDYWKDPIELRAHNVITTLVKLWPVVDGELLSEISNEDSTFGVFKSDRTYIVRWSFYTEATGYKSIKGGPSTVQVATGKPVNEKVVYFFWQGKIATKIDMGTSALSVVDLDAEGGKQVRVGQYEEPPAFLRLFNGKLVLQSSNTSSQEWRLFHYQGAFPEERHLVEVDSVQGYTLRPYLCYLAVSSSKSEVLVITGSNCNTEDAELLEKEAKLVIQSERCEKLFGKKLSAQVKTLSDVEASSAIPCLAQPTPTSGIHTLSFGSPRRLFLLTSVGAKKEGSFTFYELNSPFDAPAPSPCTLPFRQTSLYSQIQPAFVLVDFVSCVFVWQGPLPSDDPRSVSAPNQKLVSTAGSANRRRLIAEREQAIDTARNYAKARKVPAESCFFVHAGSEPLSFQLLFPEWTEQALPHGDCPSGALTLAEMCRWVQTRVYSVGRLSHHPLPPDVDPLRMEHYLADDEFNDLFKMSREQFDKLPQWKKVDLKKSVGLY